MKFNVAAFSYITECEEKTNNPLQFELIIQAFIYLFYQTGFVYQ